MAWDWYWAPLGRRVYLGPDLQVISKVDDGRLKVCDGAHGLFVMKEILGIKKGVGGQAGPLPER